MSTNLTDAAREFVYKHRKTYPKPHEIVHVTVNEFLAELAAFAAEQLAERPIPPPKHVTHFDDCGCRSARYEAEIERYERLLERAAVVEFWGNQEIYQHRSRSGKWLIEGSETEYDTALEAFEALEGAKGNE